MKIANIVIALLLTASVASAVAGTVKVPSKKPIITVNIPDSWEPEETGKGIACESPDKVATVFFEIVATEKGMNKLIDENIEWLMSDRGVDIKADTKQEKDFEVGGIKSSLMSFDASSKEFGPAKVGFIFTPINDKVLVTTYWITVKGYEKQDAALTKILNSVSPIQ